MTREIDLKNLLSKGLTGKEAGRLILEDNWLVDHQKEGLLKPKEISAIKASLKTTQDIQDYNSYVDTYRRIDYSLKEVHIVALELQIRLGALTKLILMNLFNTGSIVDLISKPAIMTEKEYQDAKAQQRERLLKELWSLDQVIDWRALEDTTVPKEISDKQPKDEYLLDWLRREYPDLWKKHVSDILDLLKAGKLKPVSITGKGKAELSLLWSTIKEIQAELPINKLPHEELKKIIDQGGSILDELTTKEAKEHTDIDKEEDDLLQSLYKAGKSKSDQSSLIHSIEKLLEGSLTQEEEDQLLLYTFCSAEDLYQAGLPEWISWIDTFKPDMLDPEPEGVAILVDPKPDQVDQRGYYKKHGTIEDLLNPEAGSFSIKDFPIILRKAGEEIKIVLAFRSIVETVSEVIGIDFGEDLREWIKDVQDAIADYNRLRLRVHAMEEIPDSIKDALQPISLEKLSPSTKTIKYLKDRVSLSLGDGWWESVSGAIVEDLQEKEAQHG